MLYFSCSNVCVDAVLRVGGIANVKKPVVYSEVAYLVGIVLLAIGNSLYAFGDLGMSMVVAPAYILHLALVDVLPFFSFGVAEYTIQALVIVALIVMMRRVKARYFLSFCTTLIYGVFLDLFMALAALLPTLLGVRIVAYVVGVLISSAGVALLFVPYFPPGLYEVFVQEIVNRWNLRLGVVKTVYDVCSLLVAVALSLLVFGGFRGIGVGTVVCAFLNGTLIQWFGTLYHRCFVFKDAFSWRNFFEGKKQPQTK